MGVLQKPNSCFRVQAGSTFAVALLLEKSGDLLCKDSDGNTGTQGHQSLLSSRTWGWFSLTLWFGCCICWVLSAPHNVSELACLHRDMQRCTHIRNRRFQSATFEIAPRPVLLAIRPSPVVPRAGAKLGTANSDRWTAALELAIGGGHTDVALLLAKKMGLELHRRNVRSPAPHQSVQRRPLVCPCPCGNHELRRRPA